MQKTPLLNACLLITGSCIGVGMLGFPVVSALAGFIPSTLAMLLCYFFATSTGLLILEATLWFDKTVNLISISKFSLGKPGKILTWILFLFLFYCIFIAYIDGGGQIFAGMLSSLLNYPISRHLGIITCVAFVGSMAYAGTKALAGVSRLFILGLMISFCALLSFAFPYVNTGQLKQVNWAMTLPTIPLFLVSFGYQNLIPTLTYYAKRNIKTLRLAIFIGNLIPFAVYFIWNFVVLSILPPMSSSSLEKVVSESDMVTNLLENMSESSGVILFAKIFSFFAILTPFMTNTKAFVDFVKDGLKISEKSSFDILVFILVLVPPTLLTLFYPHLFLQALGIAGGFADVLLFGILPPLIVWIGRYRKKMISPYQVAGGKLFLGSVLSVSVLILLITIGLKIGLV